MTTRLYILLLSSFIVFGSFTAHAKTIPDTFFGMHIQKFDTIPWPSVPFKSLRLWDGRTRWDSIETSDNVFNFTKFDKAVELAQNNNVEILYTLGLTPRWASARPNESSAFNKPGIVSEPANIDHWKRYVRKVAQRYKGKIKYYEIWNEPASKGFYTGDIPTMVMMTKYAYEIIKQTDPDALIVSPPSTASKNGAEWLDNFLKLGGGAYVDVIGFHFYVPGKPEQMPKVIRHVKKILKKHGINKPIWNTETGWGRDLKAENDLHAPFVARSYIINWSEGVEKYYWYAWDERSWVGIFMTGNDNKTPTQAAKAYTVVQKWLVDSDLKKCDVDSMENWICSLKDKNDKDAWIIWNPDKKLNYKLPSNWKINYFSTLNGDTSKISLDRNIEISPSPIYLNIEKP